MHGPVRCSRSFGFLLALMCVAASSACGDDSAGEEGSSSSSSVGPSSTTSIGTTSPTSGDGTGSGGGGGSTTVGSTSDGSTGGESTTGESEGSSRGETAGPSPVDVPFVEHDPSVLELTARVPEGWVLVTSEAEWNAWTGAPVPTGVAFPDQWVLFGSRGPLRFPGHALTVDTLTLRGTTLDVDGAQVDPADDCEVYEFIWPADVLLSFDAPADVIEDIQDLTGAVESSCAGGAADSGACDLATPCGTGLLCAGLIRSTVLANSPGGLCLDETNRGSFSGSSVAIPSDGAMASVELEVSGLTTVDMDVTVLLDVDHPAPQELVIELRNPDGNQVSVANLSEAPFHPGGIPIVPTGFSGDESVNGTWTLIVQDTVDNANSGSIEAWDLEIMSRLD